MHISMPWTTLLSIKLLSINGSIKVAHVTNPSVFHHGQWYDAAELVTEHPAQGRRGPAR